MNRLDRPRQSRHAAGRPAATLLAEHGITVSALAGHGRHAQTHTSGHAADATATAATDRLLVDLPGDVFDAAGLLRRRAHDALTRVHGCRARVRTAARVAGPDFTAQRDTVAATLHHVLLVQAAETKLVTALDDLDHGRTALAAAAQALRRFHPHGGRLVSTRPTRNLLQQRVATAASYLDAATTIAWRAMQVLAATIAQAEHLVDTTDDLVDHVLAQAAQAPPTFLRLIRAALPAAQRSDWWRELVSTFAEADPAERRRERRSLILGAPRTIWTGWAHRRADRTRRSVRDQHSDP